MCLNLALRQGRDCLVRPAGMIGKISAMEQFEGVIIRKSQLNVGIQARVRSIVIMPTAELVLNLDSIADESVNLRIC